MSFPNRTHRTVWVFVTSTILFGVAIYFQKEEINGLNLEVVVAQAMIDQQVHELEQAHARFDQFEARTAEFESLHDIWGTDQIGVEIQHKDRLLADQGAIEDILAVEDDIVPFDRADVLGAGLREGLPW